MPKLWEKGYRIDSSIEDFTVGEDYILDKKLVKADVLGSIAHAKMLAKIGILSEQEFSKLKKNLIEIYNSRNFEIKKHDEDVHTAIENHLVEKLGDIGKKIHTARSRNDQVLTDIRIYSKESLIEILSSLLELCSSILEFSRKNEFVPIAGYTHTRKAMPSSVGLWSGAFIESFLDDLIILKTAYELNNQSPLGSAAGYGVSLDIDRQFTAELLGFAKVQKNTLYVQNSRGKIESTIIFSLSQIMNGLAKISNDLILFTSEHFNYFQLPDKICTGSSIMPQKKNPDVLELVRAYSAVVEGNLHTISGITKNILSGYNRDLQLTKEPLIKSLEITNKSISIMAFVFNNLNVNKESCEKSCTKELYATDEAIALVKSGIPFREAYQKVAKNIAGIKIPPIEKNLKAKKHIGATGNLGLDALKRQIDSEKKSIEAEKKEFESAIKKLIHTNQ